MPNFRVDRNDSKTSTPCGMNSILYLGDNRRDAQQVFDCAQPGFNHWNEPDKRYGVTLARWKGQTLTGDYVVEQHKGLA